VREHTHRHQGGHKRHHGRGRRAEHFGRGHSPKNGQCC
jgi:hypothetical protein